MISSAQNDMSLECTYQDAERNHVRDALRTNAEQRFAFFEEMLAIAAASGALKRELDRRADVQLKLWTASEPEQDHAHTASSVD